MAFLRHIPNVLTGLRLVAAPATVGLLTSGHFGAALGLFAVAGISDAADGYLAKRFNLTSRLGRFLDPLADKALMVAAFTALIILDVVPMWLAVVVFGREILFLLAILLAAAVQAPLHVTPLIIGKIGTALQIVYIVSHLAALAFGFDIGFIEPGASYVLAGVAILSVFPYGLIWLRAMRIALSPGGAGL